LRKFDRKIDKILEIPEILLKKTKKKIETKKYVYIKYGRE
tara:strand:- start:864 stop:983 length:120 start_codon:yes stop_codon:yes gene_type:complete